MKMRTRRTVYSCTAACETMSITVTGHPHKRSQSSVYEISTRPSKKCRLENHDANSSSGFDALHDDLVVSIMVSLSSTASSPGDLINLMLTCKRLYVMGMHPLVLAKASVSTLAVKAARWSDGAHRFLKRCADSGNLEACFTLGMIRFYCLNLRPAGASLMAKAAMASHASALHSLAIVQFNGSGGSRKDKDLRAGVALCAKAASMGHVDAMRELGHCLQDGYGVVKNVLEGRRLLLEANAREAAAALASCPKVSKKNASQLKMSKEAACLHHLQHFQSLSKYDLSRKPAVQRDIITVVAGGFHHHHHHHHHPVCRFLQRDCCSLLSDFGCNVPPAEVHIASKFLVEWYALHPPTEGLRLCSHANCGRPETRRHEFRRCSACGTVNYCSRACQALDWKIRHKYECQPIVEWEDRDDSDAEEADEDEENAETEDMDDS